MEEIEATEEGEPAMETKNEKLVRKMLEDVHTLHAKKYDGNYDAVIELTDLADAIKEAELTDRQSEAIRLVYIDCLKHSEASNKMNIHRTTLTHSINVSVRKISQVYDKKEELEEAQ